MNEIRPHDGLPQLAPSFFLVLHHLGGLNRTRGSVRMMSMIKKRVCISEGFRGSLHGADKDVGQAALLELQLRWRWRGSIGRWIMGVGGLVVRHEVTREVGVGGRLGLEDAHPLIRRGDQLRTEPCALSRYGLKRSVRMDATIKPREKEAYPGAVGLHDVEKGAVRFAYDLFCKVGEGIEHLWRSLHLNTEEEEHEMRNALMKKTVTEDAEPLIVGWRSWRSLDRNRLCGRT